MPVPLIPFSRQWIVEAWRLGSVLTSGFWTRIICAIAVLLTLDRRRKRPILILLTSVAGLIAFVTLVTGTIYIFFLVQRLDRRALFLGATVAATSLLVLGVQCVSGLLDRLDRMAAAENTFSRLVSFIGFTYLGICASFLGTITALNLGRFIWPREVIPNPEVFVAVHILAPLAAPVLYLLLSFKVRSARMLDGQKECLYSMASIVNHFEHTHADLVSLEAAAAPANDSQHYFDTLMELCSWSLRATSIAGQYEPSQTAGGAAVLYLADPSQRRLVPVAVTGGTAEFRKRIKTNPMPFWQPEAFRTAYNNFANLAHSMSRRMAIRQFRDTTKNLVSATGVVFEVQRNLGFQWGHGSHLLVAREEHLDGISVDFQEIIGVPLFVCQRRLGVLMLLGRHTFYRRDKIYNIVGNLLGEFVRSGIVHGHFRNAAGYSLPTVYRDSLPRLTEIDLEDRERILNGIRSNFEKKI